MKWKKTGLETAVNFVIIVLVLLLLSNANFFSQSNMTIHERIVNTLKQERKASHIELMVTKDQIDKAINKDTLLTSKLPK